MQIERRSRARRPASAARSHPRYAVRFAAALAALVPALACGFPNQHADSSTWGSRDDGREIEIDDPAARREAQRQFREEEPTADALAQRLLEARKERERAGRPWKPDGAASPTALAVPTAVWINLGPTRADVDFNAAVYNSVDSGRARAIVPHPVDPNILFFATSGGGVWKTYDGGNHWEPTSDFVGSTSIGSLAMDPANPDVLYLGFGDPFDAPQPGLIRSLDGGATWLSTSLVFPTATYGTQQLKAASVTDIKVDPTDSARVLVATDVGLFSWNGVNQPQQLNLPAAPGTVPQIWSIGWVGPNVWLVTGQQAPGRRQLSVNPSSPVGNGPIGFWRSIDNGVTWTDNRGALPAADLTDLARTTLAVAQSTSSDPGTTRVFILAAGNPANNAGQSFQKDVYRSEDGGRTFVSLGVNRNGVPTNPVCPHPDTCQNDLNVMHEQAWYNQAIAVDPADPDTVLVGGNFALVRSKDGGQTWSIVSWWLPGPQNVAQPYIHADFHAMAFGLAGTKKLYVGTDGGLFNSIDAMTAPPGQTHFSDQLNVGLVTHLAFSIACAPETWPAELQAFVIGGMQDNGTRLRKLAPSMGQTNWAPSTFDQVIGGDGIGVAVSANATAGGPAAILASTPGSVRISTSGGQIGTWAPFVDGIPTAPGRGPLLPFFVRFAQDDSAPDRQTFLTITDQPDSGVYLSRGGAPWVRINGAVRNANGSVSGDFQRWDGKTAFLRFISAHPKKSGIYGLSGSSGTSWVTIDGGFNWKGANILGRNSLRSLGIKGTTNVAFDPNDMTGSRFWLGAEVDFTFDPNNDTPGATQPLPPGYGHLFLTTDGGQNWTSVLGGGSIPGVEGTATSLPNVLVTSVKVDPNDANTIYVGTLVGLYKSTDGGLNFSRDPGLPLVEVTDICVAPASGNMKIATYGRGFWQMNIQPGGALGGAKGRGDMDFDHKLDAFDLLELVAAMGTTNQSPSYKPEADLVGIFNQVDDFDLAAFLARFGGSP